MDLIGTFCIVNNNMISPHVVFDIGFNRNILYCKFNPAKFLTVYHNLI